MPKKAIHAVAATLLAALLVSAALPAYAASPRRRVVVLLAPYLTWSDVTGGSMPTLQSLASRSFLANMNVRAGAAGALTDLERGALVLSAGAPAIAEGAALSAFNATESVGGSVAADLYAQLIGDVPSGAAVLHLGQPRESAANADESFANVIGSLGSAVHEAGLKTAAIGNGDPGRFVDPQFASRPAGVAAADASGAVDLGDVSARLLRRDPLAPYGVRSDTGAIASRYRSVIAQPSVGLVVVDPGDLSRAEGLRVQASEVAIARAREDALRSTDEVLAALVDGSGPDDIIMVVSPVPLSPPDAPAPFAPFIMAAKGSLGLGTAASTHLDGVLTIADVSATIADALGAEVPPAMVGSVIGASKAMRSASVADRVGFLQRMTVTSVAIESVRGGAVNAFIVIAVIMLLGSAVILYRGAEGTPKPLCAAALAALLFVASIPLAGLLQFIFVPWPSSGLEVLGALAAITVALWLAAMALGRGRPATVPLIAVTGLTAVTILVDQWLGAPLSFAGLFGYSPLLGARYYGLGNEMAGLLLGSVLVAVALVIDTWRDRGWTRALGRWGWPSIGAVVLGTSAAPFLGANVGTIAWMTVGFLVGWLILQGHRVWTWRNLIIAVVLVAVILAGVMAIDVLGSPGTETHLGRAVLGTRAGGLQAFWTIVVRKAETNVRVLGRTNWTWLLVSVLTLLGYMRWRPRGEFAAMLKEYPAFSAAVAASLFGGVAGYFTEDSGIIIPALLLMPVGVSVLYLMLAHYRPGSGEAR